MRVLHVHSGNLYGGIESMLLTLARERNVCPDMQSAFALCFEGRLRDDLTTAGAAVYSLGPARIRQPLLVRRARQNLRGLLHREIFDVVVTHSCWSQAIFGPTVLASSLPLVFHMHGPADGKRWLERWARRTSPDRVLCNSQFTAATLTRLYPRARSQVVYCPVSPPQIPYSKSELGNTRAELQTADDATVIIQVSRIERLKGHSLHLDALGLLKDLPNWVCWLVGGAQRQEEVRYLEALNIHATRLGIADRVRFLGQRSDVSMLLAAADIYCQPNTEPDSFGISFIEALDASLPVVTTDIGGAREIVVDSCGVLVPPGDIHSLAKTLRQLIENRSARARLGMAGPGRARELCDPAIQMNRLHWGLGNGSAAPAMTG
ncbi:MAG: glycosyltransferase [Pyrinomonadaceae bacterium]